MVKTTSLWGIPPSRYYRLLRRVRINPVPADYDFCVLGCADGKFVLPAARSGMCVLAIDADRTALFGGVKDGIGGTVVMPGLRRRVMNEKLEANVTIIHGDFCEIEPRLCASVLISGALQYSLNAPRPADELLESAGRFVAPGGYLYIDYMLPFEKKYHGRPNCPNAAWWREWARSAQDWDVEYNRVLPPVKDVAHVEYPVDHYHQWGHLLARRKRYS